MSSAASIFSHLSKKLDEKHSKNLYRRATNFKRVSPTKITSGRKNLICFASNDYLGLAHHPKIKSAAIAAISEFGMGSGSSRFICGNHPLYQKLENSLAKLKKTESALVFSSGFSCAIGVICALVSEGDLIIADHLIHASLIDGSLASGAKLIRFRHNDFNHCQNLLQNNRQNFRHCLIITETVFSMDGDLAPIPELLSLAKNFDALLLTDDAHGVGIEFSKKINFVENSGYYLQMGTLSKAIGGLGGYICGKETLIDFLRNFSRTVIYSTALPPSCLSAANAALNLMKKNSLAKKTLENANYFCDLLNLPSSQSAIVPIIIGDEKKTCKIADLAKKAGFLIASIRPPTVPSGTSRLRVSFCALHKKSEIKRLADFLKSVI